MWEEDFVVRDLTDAYGKETRVWLRSGVAVQPPWSGATCPDCGGFHVTSFPAGYLARHPELVAAPDPEPEPDLAPLPDPVQAPAARTTVPGRLLIAVGVPLAVFVAYELWVNVVAAALPHH